MTQPNIVEGDYTGIDYGTVDDTHTQSSFATGGPPEVIFFTPCLYTLNCILCFWKCLAGEIKEGVQGSKLFGTTRSCVFDWRAAEVTDR